MIISLLTLLECAIACGAVYAIYVGAYSVFWGAVIFELIVAGYAGYLEYKESQERELELKKELINKHRFILVANQDQPRKEIVV